MRRTANKAAVWSDPEDAKLEVNIATAARAKKLHKKAGETTISGVEYERRLREQHRWVAGWLAGWLAETRLACQGGRGECSSELPPHTCPHRAGG